MKTYRTFDLYSEVQFGRNVESMEKRTRDVTKEISEARMIPNGHACLAKEFGFKCQDQICSLEAKM